MVSNLIISIAKVSCADQIISRYSDMPARDLRSEARMTRSPSSSYLPVHSAREKGKRREQYVNPSSDSDSSDSDLDVSGFRSPKSRRRGAHPSTKLPTIRRYNTNPTSRNSGLRANDADETDHDDEMNEIDDDNRSDVREDVHGTTEEDDTVDEDSDTPPTRTKSRNMRSEHTRQPRGLSLARPNEEESADMISNSPSTVDLTLLERENARLRQIIATLQSGFIEDRQETRHLNQNLQTLTNAVERLAEPPAPASTQPQPQPLLREKHSRSPRGGTLTVCEFSFTLFATACLFLFALLPESHSGTHEDAYWSKERNQTSPPSSNSRGNEALAGTYVLGRLDCCRDQFKS